MTEEQNSRLKYTFEAWKTSIEVQQHFNSLEMQIRNFAVTVLTAVLGAAAFTLKEPVTIAVYGYELSSTVVLLVGGLIGWLSFYLMDRFWYHRLLKGAVRQAQILEKALQDKVPGIGLSAAIGAASVVKVGDVELHSDGKLDLFYLGVSLILIALIVFAVLM